jgi:hypothetical protein
MRRLKCGRGSSRSCGTPWAPAVVVAPPVVGGLTATCSSGPAFRGLLRRAGHHLGSRLRSSRSRLGGRYDRCRRVGNRRGRYPRPLGRRRLRRGNGIAVLPSIPATPKFRACVGSRGVSANLSQSLGAMRRSIASKLSPGLGGAAACWRSRGVCDRPRGPATPPRPPNALRRAPTRRRR